MPAPSNHSYNNNLLDEHVNSELMRICKCMLPYMDHSVQKKMAMAIKAFEFVSVMNLYADETLPPPISLMRDENWEKRLLLDIRSQLSPEKAYLVDVALKIGELRNIMALKDSLDTLPSADSPPAANDAQDPLPNANKTSSAETMDKFSPFLDDNQQQMLKLFSTFMK